MSAQPPLAAHGTHVIADLYGIAPARLTDAAALEALMRRAADAAQARVLSAHLHAFGNGAGITGVLLLAESHISIHTWPEHGFAAIDIFMCGRAEPERALTEIAAGLAATRTVRHGIARGTPVDAAHPAQAA